MNDLAERINDAMNGAVIAQSIGGFVVVSATDQNVVCGEWTFTASDPFLSIIETLDNALSEE